MVAGLWDPALVLPSSLQPVVLPDVLQVTSSEFFYFALSLSSQVFMGSSLLGSAPTTLGMNGVASIDSANSHFCAVFLDQTLACAGDGSYGKLGYGNTATVSYEAPYARVATAAPSVSVAVGGAHTCALLMTGQIQCWGWNINGQLGTGDFTDLLTPSTFVQGLTDLSVSSIHSGGAHSCVLLTNGQVYCWGSNYADVLGRGNLFLGAPLEHSPTPEPVLISPSTPLTGVKQLVCSSAHNCALLLTGSLVCWGSNGDGRLGLGESSLGLDSAGYASQGPTFNEPVLSVSTGQQSHTCVLLAGGRIQCFGLNDFGQAGRIPSTGLLGSILPEPRVVVGINLHKKVKVAINSVEGVSAVAPCGSAVCVLIKGRVVCAGSNQLGQLGIGSMATTVRTLLQDPLWNQTLLPLRDITHIYPGQLSDGFCAVTATSPDIHCWGKVDHTNNGTRRSPTVYPRLRGARDIAMGLDVSCAVLGTGDVICWGDNNLGQLGVGTFDSYSSVDEAVPVPFESLGAPAKQVAVGLEAVCVLLENPTSDVRCWGGNLNRELSPLLGDISFSTTPGPVVLSDVADIQAGASHFCAIGLDGLVRCWGQNVVAQVGVEPYDLVAVSISPVPGLGRVVQIALGSYHTCALTADGDLHCWGRSYEGQTLDGFADFRSPSLRLQGVAQVTASGLNTCVVMMDSSAFCVGANDQGQQGLGDTQSRFWRTPLDLEFGF